MLLTRSNFDAQAFGGCHLGKDTGESMVHEPFAQLKTWAYTCHAYREFSAEVFLDPCAFFWHKRVEKKMLRKCLSEVSGIAGQHWASVTSEVLLSDL